MDSIWNTVLQMLEGSEITLEIFFITLVMALPLGSWQRWGVSRNGGRSVC